MRRSDCTCQHPSGNEVDWQRVSLRNIIIDCDWPVLISCDGYMEQVCAQRLAFVRLPICCLDCGDPCVWEFYSTDAFDVDWVGSYVSHARNWLHRETNDYISLAHSPPQITRIQELTMFSFFLQDIMVCTGCCGTLDFIVTHLYKTLSKRRKKNLTGMEPQPPCLRILESHPEMIQQVSWTKCSCFLTWFRFFLKTSGKEVDNGWVTVFSSEGKTVQFKKDSEIKPP